MNDTPENSSRVKCALFVDFDNIYLGLKKIDGAAAELFATEPNRWLKWIEQGMPTEDNGHGPLEKRSVLIRRCYLNPRSFSKYRPYFTRSAFSVIDCPPVTAQGKNSADIYMVMDVLDSLEHKTRFDEFIILSCDSDFAPVLLRLRAHDRRTVVFAIGPAAEAYKAACDRVITEDELVEALDATPARPAARTEVTTTAVRGRRAPAGPTAADITQEIIAEVEKLIANAQGPVLLSTAAHEIRRTLGAKVLRSRWAGAGTFQKLLQSLKSTSFGIKLTPAPAFLYDPQRHPQLVAARAPASTAPVEPSTPASTAAMAAATLAPAPEASVVEELPAELAAFARRINQVTSAPVLSPAKYTLVFDTLEEHLKTNRYHITNTSKALRDLCLAAGHSVSRRNILTILDGIRYSGYRFRPEGGDSAQAMKRSFRDSILLVCNDAQLELSEDEKHLLDTWILGTDGAAPTDAARRPEGVDWLSPVTDAPTVTETSEAAPPAEESAEKPRAGRRRTQPAARRTASTGRSRTATGTEAKTSTRTGSRSRAKPATPDEILHAALESAAQAQPAAAAQPAKTTRTRRTRSSK